MARISVLFYMVSSFVQLVCFCPCGKLYSILPVLVLYFVLFSGTGVAGVRHCPVTVGLCDPEQGSLRELRP